jgi:hypothetical protein
MSMYGSKFTGAFLAGLKAEEIQRRIAADSERWREGDRRLTRSRRRLWSEDCA